MHKVLNSAVTLIQRTTTDAPHGHMYDIGLDVHKRRSAIGKSMLAVRFTRKEKLVRHAGKWMRG